MASSIEKLKKELNKANDALYARYDTMIESAKNAGNANLAAADENYNKLARSAAAQTATARANARRAFAERGLLKSGEEAQNSALYQIGLQNVLSDLSKDRESTKREIMTKTSENVSKLEAEREKEYAENAMDIALKTAQLKADASQKDTTKEEETDSGSENTDTHVYQPLAGIFKYIPSAQRYYVPKKTSTTDTIKPNTTPSTFMNKLVDKYTTNGWEGKKVNESKIKEAVRSFIKDETVDRSYRAEVKMLAMALGYL